MFSLKQVYERKSLPLESTDPSGKFKQVILERKSHTVQSSSL